MVSRPEPKSRTTSKARKKREVIQPPSQALEHTHAMIRDSDGAINFWANGLERLYGFASGEAVGRISHKLLHTEFPRPLRDIDAELFDTGEWSGELAQRKRDGETIIVASHWGLWRDGKDSALVTVVDNEINEREQAYLASIVDSSDDAIIGKTLGGIITSWNKAAEKMFGYKADEITGESVTLLFPPERVREEEGILERLKQGSRVEHFETVRRRKDGSDVIVSLTISPILDRRGKIIGISKIARDITGQRAAQDRLAELQSELLHASRLGTMGQMAAAITHELNQPLSAVNSYLSGVARLLSGTDNPPSVAEGLSKAREQTTRAGEIVRRLRDLAAKRETDRRIENINEIVEQTLGLALVDVKVRGVKTRVLLSPDLNPVLVDKIQIGQVILNIARNAVEAMESTAERSLTISTTPDPYSHGIEVRIADTGLGLSPEIKERLFQPFVTTKDKGMGLGLSICRNIIDSHGGSLSAEPNDPNGTVFLIRLPNGDSAGC